MVTNPDPDQKTFPSDAITTALDRRAFIARAGGIAALLATGVTGAGLVSGRGSTATAAALPIVDKADQEPLDLLKRMLAHDTQNFGNGGKPRPHAEILKSIWDNAAVSTEIIPTPDPDNVHLIARIKGTTSAPPLLMLGHSDVVPVERDNWTIDPFKGIVKNGEIHGRGAPDMKGANAAAISALLRHIGEGGAFDRDIIVLTDADEEAGDYGSRWLAKNHRDKLTAGTVLTQGGWFLSQRDQKTPMLITVTRQDKVYFNLDLTADGVGPTRPNRTPTRRSSRCPAPSPSSATGSPR